MRRQPGGQNSGIPQDKAGAVKLLLGRCRRRDTLHDRGRSFVSDSAEHPRSASLPTLIKVSKKAKPSGGKPFSRCALLLLSNRIYVGEIRHKKQYHPGRHEPTVSGKLGERVQE